MVSCNEDQEVSTSCQKYAVVLVIILHIGTYDCTI